MPGSSQVKRGQDEPRSKSNAPNRWTVIIQRVNFETKPTRERKLAQPQNSSGVSKALNAAWIRPFLFLIFIVIAWDLTIRLFKILPYQIPASADVGGVLWQDWPELACESWPTTYATSCGFLSSAAFVITVALLIA